MRSDARANRAAVVAAARRLIAARDATVSVNAIAAEAGIGVATLYRHFPSREDLLYAIVADTRERVVTIVEGYTVAAVSDPAAWWSSFVRAIAALRPGAMVAVVAETLPDAAGRDEFVRLRADIVTAVDAVLTKAKAAGAVRDDVTAVQFQLGLAAITRPLPATTADIPELDGHEAWLVEVYIRGLRPTSR